MIKCHSHAVLARRIEPLMAEAEQTFEKTGKKQRLFNKAEYAAGTWDRPRRVLMKVQQLPKKAQLPLCCDKTLGK